MPDDLKLTPQVYEPGEGGNTAEGPGSRIPPVRSGVTTVVGSGQGFTVQRQVLDLPLNGRTNSVNNLALLSPGVAAPPPATSLSEAMTRPDSSVEAAATGSEVGDLFEYKIDQPITV